jgi:hypothetical protein
MVLTFVIITAVLYGVLMLAPVEARAALYCRGPISALPTRCSRFVEGPRLG